MKDYQYHLINAGIAGALVSFGSLIPLLTGDIDIQGIMLGVGIGFVTGVIVFLNKMGDWLKTQDPDYPQNLKILNFL